MLCKCMTELVSQMCCIQKYLPWNWIIWVRWLLAHDAVNFATYDEGRLPDASTNDRAILSSIINDVIVALVDFLA
jgi:hypothetical protein